ncbi:hypothetical protein [Streptantibioticus silvisoli]|uniref:Toxin-antitoxin system HicB family antitoxin n=1 Tax=Streptantibioticus silvisoli TaxID=2705255 RepID=A0ABT6W3B5_9ACTN|nr:hypothetical protein [Streptantibioticus silvisoli]MDI5964011.1 hypothetical protein [Streptantibioticus silvisoli]
MTDSQAPRGTERDRERKKVLLRLDPAIHDAVSRWASDELRSANAQIEFLLRRALTDAGRLPTGVRPIARRGRPPRDADRDRPEEGRAEQSQQEQSQQDGS